MNNLDELILFLEKKMPEIDTKYSTYPERLGYAKFLLDAVLERLKAEKRRN